MMFFTCSQDYFNERHAEIMHSDSLTYICHKGGGCVHTFGAVTRPVVAAA